jgi:hypothetical protein
MQKNKSAPCEQARTEWPRHLRICIRSYEERVQLRKPVTIAITAAGEYLRAPQHNALQRRQAKMQRTTARVVRRWRRRMVSRNGPAWPVKAAGDTSADCRPCALLSSATLRAMPRAADPDDRPASMRRRVLAPNKHRRSSSYSRPPGFAPAPVKGLAEAAAALAGWALAGHDRPEPQAAGTSPCRPGGSTTSISRGGSSS